MKSSADGLFPADNVLISNNHSVHSTHGCHNASMCIKIRPSFAFLWTRRLSARRKHKSRPCVTQKRDLKPQLENSSSAQRVMGDAPRRHSIDLTEKQSIFQVCFYSMCLKIQTFHLHAKSPQRVCLSRCAPNGGWSPRPVNEAGSTDLVKAGSSPDLRSAQILVALCKYAVEGVIWLTCARMCGHICRSVRSSAQKLTNPTFCLRQRRVGVQII